MFGCEYRDGRAAAAPLLRPLDEVNQVDAADDPEKLPHLHSPEEIDRLFPAMVVPMDDETAYLDYDPDERNEKREGTMERGKDPLGDRW